MEHQGQKYSPDFLGVRKNDLGNYLLIIKNDLAQQLKWTIPDKPFHDWEKVEKFFIRLAKKYSACHE